MSDDAKAPGSQDALSAMWDINREFAGAVTLALLLLYHKFTHPGADGQATLEPGKALDDDPATFSAGDPLHLDWLSELPEVPSLECCGQIVGAIDQLTTAVKEIKSLLQARGGGSDGGHPQADG